MLNTFVGISLLYRKPMREPPSTFSFMSPFSSIVWIYLGAAYITVSLCFFCLGRISPSQWENRYPCIEEPTYLENQFTLNNSMWFAIGALLQQGSEIEPKYHFRINQYRCCRHETFLFFFLELHQYDLHHQFGGSLHLLWFHHILLI